jgi:predicted amino acid-binding ACT domain protein
MALSFVGLSKECVMSTFKFRVYNETEVIISIRDLSRLEAESTEIKAQLEKFKSTHNVNISSSKYAELLSYKSRLASAIDYFNIILMLDISGKDNQGKIASVAREFLENIKE